MPSELLSLTLTCFLLPSVTYCPEKSTWYFTQLPEDLGPVFTSFSVFCCKQHTPILTNISRMGIYFKNTKQLTEFMGKLANQVWRPQSQKPSPKSDCRNGPMKALLSLLSHRETTACMAGSPSAATRYRDPADGMQPSSKALPAGEGTCIISLLPSPSSN